MQINKVDFITNFDPDIEDHLDYYRYYKQKGTLPYNNEFKPIAANYDVACLLIEGKIAQAWYEHVERRNITPRNRTRSRSDSSERSRLCVTCNLM